MMTNTNTTAAPSPSSLTETPTADERYAQRLNMINDGAHFPHHDLIDREIRTHGEAMSDNNGKLIHLTPTGFVALTYYRAN